MALSNRYMNSIKSEIERQKKKVTALQEQKAMIDLKLSMSMSELDTLEKSLRDGANAPSEEQITKSAHHNAKS